MSRLDTGNKFLTQNRRASFDYEIIETFEAGVSLLGSEVKSVKAGQITINGAYAVIKNNSVDLLNATITLLQQKNAAPGYDENRTRKLLLNQKEIDYIVGKLNEKGLTLIPINVYIKKGLVKLTVALARKRKNIDKREYLKKRDIEKEVRRQE